MIPNDRNILKKYFTEQKKKNTHKIIIMQNGMKHHYLYRRTERSRNTFSLISKNCIKELKGWPCTDFLHSENSQLRTILKNCLKNANINVRRSVILELLYYV